VKRREKTKNLEIKRNKIKSERNITRIEKRGKRSETRNEQDIDDPPN